MPIAIPSIPNLAVGATFADPKLARPLAPKEPLVRDYGGYTDLQIPTVTWPGAKNMALNISIHFEEGAEATPENGDEFSEVLMGETDRRPLRKGRDFPMESVYEFGSKRGIWRLYALLEELGFTFSLITCGRSAELAPAVVTQAVSMGAEIVASNYRYANYDLVPEDIEAAHIRGSLEILRELSPSNEYPKGYYIERPSISSSALIAQAYDEVGSKLGYDSSVYGDDLPYYGADGRLLIPHTLDCNDHKFVDAPGFSSPDDFLEHLNNALDVLLAEGRKGKPKMMTLALHPHIIGRPGRFVALKQFLKRVQAESDDIWICQKQDIAKHWTEHHPAV